jgi:gluconolactonase
MAASGSAIRHTASTPTTKAVGNPQNYRLRCIGDPVRHIRVFDVPGDGERLRAGEHFGAGRLFHKITPGYADGFRIDEDGNLWCSAADGVQCIAPDGTKLGAINVPFPVSNLAFGGRNRSRLFICASHTLFAIYTNQRGALRP